MWGDYNIINTCIILTPDTILYRENCKGIGKKDSKIQREKAHFLKKKAEEGLGKSLTDKVAVSEIPEIAQA